MAPKAHAILSPSAAARWLKCPASVAMTASMPEETSLYALEGSIAHAVAESVLTGEPYKAPEGAERLNEWCCEVAERVVQRSFAAWGEVAAEIDGRVEHDIKAIREAA